MTKKLLQKDWLNWILPITIVLLYLYFYCKYNKSRTGTKATELVDRIFGSNCDSIYNRLEFKLTLVFNVIIVKGASALRRFNSEEKYQSPSSHTLTLLFKKKSLLLLFKKQKRPTFHLVRSASSRLRHNPVVLVNYWKLFFFFLFHK